MAVDIYWFTVHSFHSMVYEGVWSQQKVTAPHSLIKFMKTSADSDIFHDAVSMCRCVGQLAEFVVFELQ